METARRGTDTERIIKNDQESEAAVRLRLFLLSIAVLALVRPASAGPEAGDDHLAGAMSRITLDLQQVPLRRALELVCGGAGLRYSMAADVPDVPVDLKLRDMPVKVAVRRIVRAAARQVPGLGVDSEGEIWSIAIQKVPSRVTQFRGPGWRVSLAAQGVPLRRALDTLFANADMWCVVDPNVPDVPVNIAFRDVPLRSGVWLVVGAASARGPRLALRQEGDNFVLGLQQRPGAPAVRVVAPAQAKARPVQSRVNVNLRYVPLRKALKTASGSAPLRCIVEPNVPDVPVTMQVRNLTAEAAVQQITSVASLSARGMNYARAGDVVVVYMEHRPGRL
jgi:hypothetical protein